MQISFKDAFGAAIVRGKMLIAGRILRCPHAYELFLHRHESVYDCRTDLPGGLLFRRLILQCRKRVVFHFQRSAQLLMSVQGALDMSVFSNHVK